MSRKRAPAPPQAEAATGLPCDANATVRMVTCPQCKGESVFAPSNPHRPFCSQRCKDIDFGAWAEESFRVPENQEPDSMPAEDQRLQ